MKKEFSLILVALLISHLTMAADGWVELFNGKNLDGWEQKNGKADYSIDNGEIVGVSKLKTPNSFLCTEKEYGDFILELEVKVDPRLNSGIQFRSHSKADYNNYRVHGYQCEIDPSPRAYSGGIYDEARRGWLYHLGDNLQGQKAFVNGQWNKYRIEAIGNTIRTWINGIQCVNLIDDVDASGFIALQVHGIGTDKEKDGSSVRWKNIRILTNGLEKARWEADPEVREINLIPNTLSDTEIRKGWRLLWDGKSTKGWRGAKLDQFPTTGWEMKEGVLTVLESGGGESEHGGDIITIDKFSEFELMVDFKITKGANSGIKYFVDPELNKESGSAIGLEYQVLDDDAHPDAKNGISGNRTCASLYDLIKAENLTLPGGKKGFNRVDKWNRARIIVQGNHVEHWLNQNKVIEYERGSQIYRALVAYSKYKKWPAFGESPAGHILLQDHGNTVQFRSIKIREF